jgi:hypothetical protein
MENFMTRLFTISSALALAVAAPAVAQQADPMMTSSTPEAPMPTEMPAPADPSVQPAPASEPAPAAPAAESAANSPADTRVATVTQLVEAEFPSYDADKNGDLTQPEFTKWVLALHSKAEDAKAATKMDDAAKAKWAKNAFATADVDKSKKVSKAELTTFLLG